MGKSLSCIAATSTIGAVAVIPKVKSTLVSLQRGIGSLEDLKLSTLSETTTSSQVSDKKTIKELISKVTSWLSTNGNCKISLAITGEEGKYYEVKGEGETTDINHSLFVSHNGMQGKSKFERLVEDLENGRKNKSGQEKYSEYLKEFKERCQNNNNKVLKLQWKSQILENKDTQDNTHSESLEGLMNLWVDEKE